MWLGALAAAAMGAQAACLPSFPYKGGWLGGDAAYSVGLPDGRALWLFGDTFVGKPEAADRRGAAMIANSVGLSTCGASGFEVSYSWGAGETPRAFFEAGEPALRYWPFGGFAHEGSVYVALGRIRTTGTGPFDFAFEGTDLARVTPGASEPSRWVVRVSTLSAERGVSVAGTTIEGGFAYFFVAGGSGHPIRLARVSLRELDRPTLRYVSQTPIFSPGTSELSVARVGKRWRAVYSQDGLPSPAVVSRTAARLEGPWSEEKVLFAAPKRDGAFCYAGKEHPEFGLSPMIVTYACNAFKPEDVLGDLSLYRPEVRRVSP